MPRIKRIDIYKTVHICLDYELILQFLKGTHEIRKLAFRISLHKMQFFLESEEPTLVYYSRLRSRLENLNNGKGIKGTIDPYRAKSTLKTMNLSIWFYCIINSYLSDTPISK